MVRVFPGDILLGCRVRDYFCRIVDANAKDVLPREVAQAAIVPTNLYYGALSRNVGKELPRFDLCPFGWTDSQHNWKPSQHTCSFRGYLRDNHRTNVLSTFVSLNLSFYIFLWYFPVQQTTHLPQW